jgi:DNA integrity scanning protein DisA with diadenylate cyclase activity
MKINNENKDKFNIFDKIHGHVNYLNTNKFFAGVIMILLNIGSKFITIQFSKSCEEYLKMTISKQILVFAMSWLGTRSIYEALALTAIFTILSDHLFNDESYLCIVPQQYRVLHTLNTNNMNTNISSSLVSQEEINSAIQVLEKAKREKEKLNQQTNYNNFYNNKI